jgi:putative ABC transport system permease protein
MNVWRMALRTLRREWHLVELRTLAASLVLAVAALGVVSTLSARMERGLLASAAELIGGDAGVSAPAPLPPALHADAKARGLAATQGAQFRSVAFVGDRSQLLDVLATDAAYPLRGTLEVQGAGGRNTVAHGPARGALFLDHRAMVGLGVRPGDRVQLGGQPLVVAAELVRQPDGGELFALAPRAVMNLDDANAAGLLGVGSRARHRLLVAGAPGAVAGWRSDLDTANLPAGAEQVTPEKVQERMRSAFDRAGAFLRLTALLSALLAGVAIALAASRYARRKAPEVALLRALGTPRRTVVALLVGTLAALAVPAALLGVLIALGMAQGAWLFAQQLFQGIPTTLPLGPALAAGAMGLAVLAGFALPPLVRLAEVPPVAVFRDSMQRRVRRFDALYLVPLVTALGLLWVQSESFRLAGVLAGSLVGVAALAALLAALLLVLARRVAPGAHPALRIGLAALARRRGLSLVQATSLSLGLCALLLLAVIAPSLLEGWRRELPQDTPNWFALNLQDDQRQAFDDALRGLGASKVNMMPLAVGKLAAINGTPVDQLPFASDDDRDAADRQLRLSWAGDLPPSNQVVEGQWGGASPRTAEVSVDTSWRDRFHLKIGDTLRFEVGEGTLDARVSSVRKVDWTSFRVNFFLLLDPAHAQDLPHTWLTSFYMPRGSSERLSRMTRDFSNLSLIDVDALLDRVRDIVDRVSGAVRWVLGFSLLAGALVLTAALAASAQERRKEAALLRTLGATRAQLRAAAACEFALLGLVAGLTAAIGAFGAGYWMGHAVFRIEDFVPPVLPLVATAAVAAVVVMLIGLAGTRRVLRTSPMALLRE